MRAAFVPPTCRGRPTLVARSVRDYLVRALAETAEVDLYSVSDAPDSERGPLSDFCRSVTVERLVPPATRPRWLQEFTSLAPRSVRRLRTTHTLNAMRARLSAPYDLLISDDITMAPYVLDVRGHEQTPTLVMRQKIDHIHVRQIASTAAWGPRKVWYALESARLWRFEHQMMPRFAGGVVCSAEDKKIAGRQGGSMELEIVVNGADAWPIHATARAR